jgi:hypothetical protein
MVIQVKFNRVDVVPTCDLRSRTGPHYPGLFHIEDVMTCFRTEEARGDSGEVSDALAEIAAVESMFPYEDRQKIAERYKVPQVKKIVKAEKPRPKNRITVGHG